MTVFPSLSFILLLTCVLAAQQSPLPKTSPQYTDPVSETVLENKHKLLEVFSNPIWIFVVPR